jgi:hypothetical protein
MAWHFKIGDNQNQTYLEYWIAFGKSARVLRISIASSKSLSIVSVSTTVHASIEANDRRDVDLVDRQNKDGGCVTVKGRLIDRTESGQRPSTSSFSHPLTLEEDGKIRMQQSIQGI